MSRPRRRRRPKLPLHSQALVDLPRVHQISLFAYKEQGRQVPYLLFLITVVFRLSRLIQVANSHASGQRFVQVLQHPRQR